MKITYVCNAGFFLETDGFSVAVDPFSERDGLYLPTPEVWKKYIMDRAESGKPMLMAITHGHADHYCRRDVLRTFQISARSGADMRILTTDMVAEDLLGNASGELLPALRRKLVIIPEQKDLTVLPDFFSLRICAGTAVHDGKQYSGLKSLFLLVESTAGNGMEDRSAKYVFTGDASPGRELFERIAGWSERIDWLFAPFPFVGRPSVRRLLSSALKVEHIGACHFPLEEADLQNWGIRTESVCREAKDCLPDPLFLRKAGTVVPL